MDDEKHRAEQARLDAYACPTSDGRENPPSGVLLSDQIRHFVASFKLIDGFDEKQLKAAGYELTIGDEYSLGGEKHTLSADGSIKIPPFNVVVIKTSETINLPRFLIARWNIRVKWAYKGLLWVGAAQVDPGWVGHLFCPIYNLSDKDVEVRAGDPIALMDFVTTTPFDAKSCAEYHRPPKRLLLEEYTEMQLRSGLTELAENEIKKFRADIKSTQVDVHDKISALQGRVDNFTSITFAVVGLLFAAVTLFFGKPDKPNWWDPSVFWVSALAIIISLFSWINSRSSVQWFRKAWHRIAFELVIFLLILTAITFFSLRTQDKIVQLNNLVEQLQKRVDAIPSTSPTPVRNDSRGTKH